MSRADKLSGLRAFRLQEKVIYCDPDRPLEVGKPVLVHYADSGEAWKGEVDRIQTDRIIWVRRAYAEGVMSSRIDLDSNTQVLPIAAVAEDF